MIETKNHTQSDQLKRACGDIFFKKMEDYGPAWVVMRLPSLTDQIYIKLNRIISIREKQEQKIKDGIDTEYIGIFNYSIIALIKIELLGSGADGQKNIDNEKAGILYSKYLKAVEDGLKYYRLEDESTLEEVNKVMVKRIEKLRQIEDSKDKEPMFEDRKAHYYELIDYSVFGLIIIGKI